MIISIAFLIFAAGIFFWVLSPFLREPEEMGEKKADEVESSPGKEQEK